MKTSNLFRFIAWSLIGWVIWVAAMYRRATQNIEGIAHYFESKVAYLENEMIVKWYDKNSYDSSNGRIKLVEKAQQMKTDVDIINSYYSHISKWELNEAYAIRIWSDITIEEFNEWYTWSRAWSRIIKRNINDNYELEVYVTNKATRETEGYDVELTVTKTWKIDSISSMPKSINEAEVTQSAVIDWEIIQIEIIPNDENETEVWEKLILKKWGENILIDSTHARFGEIRANIDMERGWIVYSKNYHEWFSNHIYDIAKYRSIELWPGSIDGYSKNKKYLYSCFPTGVAGMSFTIVDIEHFRKSLEVSYNSGAQVRECLPYDEATNSVGYLGKPQEWKPQVIRVYDFDDKKLY